MSSSAPSPASNSLPQNRDWKKQKEMLQVSRNEMHVNIIERERVAALGARNSRRQLELSRNWLDEKSEALQDAKSSLSQVTSELDKVYFDSARVERQANLTTEMLEQSRKENVLLTCEMDAHIRGSQPKIDAIQSEAARRAELEAMSKTAKMEREFNEEQRRLATENRVAYANYAALRDADFRASMALQMSHGRPQNLPGSAFSDSSFRAVDVMRD